MGEARFRAEVRPSGRGSGGHLVEVPPGVVAALGGKARIPVAATFDSVPYRGSIVRMGGSAVLGLTKAIMAEIGVGAGDTVTVVVANDDVPREVEVPPELVAALGRDPTARAYFESLSYSHQREYVGYLTEAKKHETRQRRAERTIAMLREQAASRR